MRGIGVIHERTRSFESSRQMARLQRRRCTVGTRASVPPSLVLYHPSAGRSDQRESHQRRPTRDVKTHCDISLCPAFKLGLRSPRIRLASLLARIPPINNRHALFSLPFRVVEHPSSSTDFAIAIRIDEFALTPLAPRKSALERI